MLRRARRLGAALIATALPATGLAAFGLAGAATASAQGIAGLARRDEMPTLRAIDVPAAWRITRGKGVLVGVLDTGADPTAPDLTGSVITGPNYAAGADPAGYRPPHLHGTYISSLIAGHGSGPGRSEGVIGVAPQARILSVRVILDDGEPGFGVFNSNASYYDTVASGIRYAVRHGVGVINMSLGTTVPTRDMRQAIAYAISRGVVVVAAAGNDGSSRIRFTPYSYPASFTGVIAVAAVNSGGKRAYFSDRNASVVVSAPGVNVTGAGPGGSYLTGSGTSPASALVAGIAALIRSRYPRLSPALVAQAIIASCRRRPSGGYSTSTGFGEVDAAAALAAAARIAAQRPAADQSPAGHFGGGFAGPVTVVPRDAVRAAVLLVVAALGAIGFLAAACGLILLPSRRRRKTGEAQAVS